MMVTVAVVVRTADLWTEEPTTGHYAVPRPRSGRGVPGALPSSGARTFSPKPAT